MVAAEWLHRAITLAQEKGKVPKDCKKAVILPLKAVRWCVAITGE